MTVDISACGPDGERHDEHLYRDGLDANAIRVLVAALKPLLPNDAVYPAKTEDDWQFYGVLAHDLHPDDFNGAIARLRTEGDEAVKAALATLGDDLLTELGSQGQRIRLSASPYMGENGREFDVTVATDGNALDEPTRNLCVSNAKALYRAYGLSEPDGREFHCVRADEILARAAGKIGNDLARIAAYALKRFGPDATVGCA